MWDDAGDRCIADPQQDPGIEELDRIKKLIMISHPRKREPVGVWGKAWVGDTWSKAADLLDSRHVVSLKVHAQ